MNVLLLEDDDLVADLLELRELPALDISLELDRYFEII